MCVRLLPKRVANDDAKWQAVAARDSTFDSLFYFCVTSTLIYCKPSCPARRPKRENVRFHNTCAEAEAAGFKACKRCKPSAAITLIPHADKVLAACRNIGQAEGLPSLQALSREAGLSAHHFHRIFTSIVGVTPKAFGTEVRSNRARLHLQSQATVTGALYDAGFNSDSRFYAAAPSMLGMSASAYKNGGNGESLRFAVGQCSLGAILVAESAKGICAILIGDDAETLVKDLQDRFPNAALTGADRRFEKKVATVVGFVDEPICDLKLPLDIRGTAFQHKVWQALRKVPPGSTVTYTEIAALIGQPTAARAVAGACAANPIAVAIPCHRVVRTNGDLSGYRWGVERKRALLTREKPSP